MMLYKYAVAFSLLFSCAAAQSASSCDANLYVDNACMQYLSNTSMSTVYGPRPVSADKARDLCYLSCFVCANSQFLAWQVSQISVETSFCTLTRMQGPTMSSADDVIGNASEAILNTSSLHGWNWLDDEGDIEENATQAVAALVGGMPRRDLMLLASDTSLTVDFLLEHVRYALRTRAWSRSMNISWPVFVDSVLPYSILDEKRDIWFRWRPRFSRLFSGMTAGASSISDVMRALAAAIPRAAALGTLALTDSDNFDILPGPPITWHSSVSPAYISVEQVAAFGGSCTGTAAVLVAAARSVGVPARLAGCGESGQSLDDHHWVEYFSPPDSADGPGPFGDGWHTKEGVSVGNAGGPWDSPSGPMLGCLAGVVPYSSLDSLWAASWTSATYMPLLWSNDTYNAAWSFVGGLDRCGAYCTAWGCGVNNSVHYSQAQCSQFPDMSA